jgi:hypothetical protein
MQTLTHKANFTIWQSTHKNDEWGRAWPQCIHPYMQTSHIPSMKPGVKRMLTPAETSISLLVQEEETAWLVQTSVTEHHIRERHAQNS